MAVLIAMIALILFITIGTSIREWKEKKKERQVKPDKNNWNDRAESALKLLGDIIVFMNQEIRESISEKENDEKYVKMPKYAFSLLGVQLAVLEHFGNTEEDLLSKIAKHAYRSYCRALENGSSENVKKRTTKIMEESYRQTKNRLCIYKLSGENPLPVISSITMESLEMQKDIEMHMEITFMLTDYLKRMVGMLGVYRDLKDEKEPRVEMNKQEKQRSQIVTIEAPRGTMTMSVEKMKKLEAMEAEAINKGLPKIEPTKEESQRVVTDLLSRIWGEGD